MEPCSTWDGSDLLGVFLKNSVSEHVPRPTTGKIPIKKQGYVMTVQADEKLPEVFKKLTTEGFLGAPVCDGNTLVGHISLLDLVKYVNGLFFGTTEDEWAEFWQKKLFFNTATARSIIQSPDEYLRNPVSTMTNDFSSFAALETMARMNTHQIVLLDDAKEPCGIITTSMLISFLRQNKVKWCKEFKNLKVGDFTPRLMEKTLATVTDTELAINAFLRMEEQDVHGLPIVDDGGVLVGCISARDLRGVGTDGSHFFRLYRSVRQFKALCQKDYDQLAPSTHYTRKQLPSRPVYVTPESNMDEVIAKMEDGNLHRVFVCTEASHRRGKPYLIGVLSQTDVLLQCLLHMVSASKTLKLSSQATREERQAPRKVSQRRSSRPGMEEERKTSPTKRTIAIH